MFTGPRSCPRVASDFVYHVAEMASLLLVGACVVLMSTKLSSTYQREVDTFGALHIPSKWGTLYIFVPCLLLAMVRMVPCFLLLSRMVGQRVCVCVFSWSVRGACSTTPSHEIDVQYVEAY